ncbi:aminotransferase class I/II-fold pyridoxal phosphate-dependent enzyme, partial [bacterium]|nr:aminotransferase class I/II-fold pyridoxal phosphate-dependent enzyme [bacterium]
PVYENGATILNGAVPYMMPLKAENNFLPDLSRIPSEIIKKSKLMFLNYPNNPTTATASKEFFEEAVKFARDNNIIICHDAAYSEIAFDGYKPVSFLEVDGAKEIGIEFHSLSKTYNMTGWRMGFALGNKKVINCLAQVKSHIDSGIFRAVQFAGIVALSNTDHLAELLSIYKERRDLLVEGLKGLGWNINKPKATFYVWASVLSGYTSMELSKILLDKYGIVVTPGVGFGQNGEGFIRFALTVSVGRIKESMERIKKFHG